MLRLGTWALAAAVLYVSTAGAHTRSQSHAVWEIKAPMSIS
jgi:hypothetical protein